jgi:cell division protein FtsQ
MAAPSAHPAPPASSAANGRADGGKRADRDKRAETSRESGRESPPEQTRRSDAAARRRLRKVARARRRFEHAEVRRFTRRSRRRRATWITLASIVAVLGITLAVAVYSPILALRTITVDGTSRLSAAALRTAVDGQLGTPLALIDFDQIKRELATYPLIRSYATETVPPHTLRIHVIERQPVAILKRGALYDQVDPAGVVIASSTSRPALPLIDVGSNGVDSAAFNSAVRVLLAMPASVKEKVTTITAKTADDVELALQGTAPGILWGGPENSALKATVLAAMLQRPECTSLAVIDVSAPLAPICGPK